MTLLHALVVSFALAAAPLTAAAQDWPARSVRFVEPFPAGGSTDVGARVVAEYLSRTFGQQIVVENRSGANGNVGIESVAKSAPDGYTVLIGTDAVSSNPHVYKMSIDPLKELVPVVQLSRQPIALAAHPSLGASTLADVTALAKQQPGLRFGTGSGVDGAFVPAGTPPPIAAKLNAEIGKALSDEKVRTSLAEQALDPVGGTAEQFAKLVREDYDKYARLVRQLNIKPN